MLMELDDLPSTKVSAAVTPELRWLIVSQLWGSYRFNELYWDAYFSFYSGEIERHIGDPGPQCVPLPFTTRKDIAEAIKIISSGAELCRSCLREEIQQRDNSLVF